MLTYAATTGKLDIVNLFLTNGADVNKANNDGYTPISQASLRGHLEVVKALIKAEAEVNKADDDGRTPISRASWRGEHRRVEEERAVR